MSRVQRVLLSSLLAFAVGAPVTGAVLAASGGGPAQAATLPSGFAEQIVFSGLDKPTKVAFAPDGRVFVAEKKGTIKVFDSLSDPSPTLFADLSTNVYDYEDLGLLGLALPPNFPSSPYVYVSYAYDAPIGATAPVFNDRCATPSTGCVVSGRVSRLRAAGNQATGAEQVLVNGWCTQFESHGIGNLAFGPDGALYVSAGDGASAVYTDWGQSGSPVNPCGDPPAGVGGAMSPPSAEGGALRAQDLRTSGDPTGLSGTMIRIDPATGAAKTDNPLYGSTTDANARRIVAYGLRNPFRWTFRPGTSEVWFGDVGWRNWEEINRLVNPLAPTVTNFGWPCYEGNLRQPGYDSADLALCENLYAAGGVTHGYFQYSHANKVVPGEACPTGGSSPTGLAFYPTAGGTFPAQYAGALFFGDYARQCIWAMLAGANGLPNPANIVTFAPGVAGLVDLQVGPGGDLYYVDHTGGTVRRIRYSSGNQPPSAAISATPTSGPPPLAVSFSSAGSTDPDSGDVLTFQWDFTNDGTFDATGATATYTYSSAGTYTARLKVTDAGGLSDSKTVQILAGTAAPTPVIDTPTPGTTWATGQTLSFTGHATDPQDGNLPASLLRWDLVLQHCYTADNCHSHPIQTWNAVASGSFAGSDHEYPSYLELKLTATDSGGLSSSTTRRLDPRTVNLTFATNPSGLQLTVGSTSGVAPFTRTVIQGSTSSMSAPTPQSLGGTTYTFSSWSDGGAATHVTTAPATATTYTATYTTAPSGCGDSFGYTCRTEPRPFVSADTVLPLTGDDAVAAVALPFPVKLYGQSYSTAYVDTNGVVSFVNPGGAKPANGTLPAVAAPNAAVYPFWDDLVVDASSSVRGKAVGSAPNRQYVIEWRNVYIYGNTSRRLTFEAILSENGDVVTNYASLDNDAEKGASATVGIENGAGQVASQRSFNSPTMQAGTAVVFTAPTSQPPPPPPAAGSVSGKVTAGTAATPVVGATVTLSPGGASTTTSATGAYTFSNVAFGSYTVTASYGGQQTSAPVTVDGAETVDLNLPSVPPPTPGGYTVSTAQAPFVAADATVLPVSGDDNIVQVTLPAPVVFYGVQYTTAWVDTNGKLSFVNPGTAYVEHGALPSPAPPNASVYPFWRDLVCDSQASIRMALVNGSVVVEWRNVHIYGNLTGRLSFSVVFSSNGTVTLHYASLDNDVERGSGATVGLENPTGTVATQYSYNQPTLRSGTAVVFSPSA